MHDTDSDNSLVRDLGLPCEVWVASDVPPPVGKARSSWSKLWLRLKPGDSFEVPAGYGSSAACAARRLGVSYTRRINLPENRVRFWRLLDNGENPLVEAVRTDAAKIADEAKAIREWVGKRVRRERGTSLTMDELYGAFCAACRHRKVACPGSRAFRAAMTAALAQIHGLCPSSSVMRSGKACRGFHGAKLTMEGR